MLLFPHEQCTISAEQSMTVHAPRSVRKQASIGTNAMTGQAFRTVSWPRPPVCSKARLQSAQPAEICRNKLADSSFSVRAALDSA